MRSTKSLLDHKSPLFFFFVCLFVFCFLFSNLHNLKTSNVYRTFWILTLSMPNLVVSNVELRYTFLLNMSKISLKTWPPSTKIYSQGWGLIDHNSLTICPIIINLGTQLQSRIGNRSTKAFWAQPVGVPQVSQTCMSKPSKQNFTSLGVHALGVSINQNLKCHIDRCKWVWPITYLLITRASVSISLKLLAFITEMLHAL